MPLSTDPKAMGIMVLHQHLHQLPHFDAEAYAYPLFNIEQLVDLTEDSPAFHQDWKCILAHKI